MENRALLALIGLLLFGSAFAQWAPGIEWERAVGGSGSDYTADVEQTIDGGYIAAGSTHSNNGDVSGNHGGDDLWVVKLDATGALIWQKPLGGSLDDRAYSIEQTSDGGYVAAGYTTSNNGDVTGYHGGDDMWVVKLDASGTLLWQKALGGSDGDYAQTILRTSDNGYIIAGQTSSNDGDVTGNHGDRDFWIVKLDSAGTVLWQKTFGGTSYDTASSIAFTSDGGYVAAGLTYSINGDVTGNQGENDFWIVKFDDVGTLLWQRTLGGSDVDGAGSILQTADGGYIVAGVTSSADGDVTGNHGGRDVWVVKLDSTGALSWQRAIGGSGDDSAHGIQLTNDGGYILSGHTTSNDGDVSGNHGNYDTWVMKLDSIGWLEWQKPLGGSDYDVGGGIQQTADGGCVVASFARSSDGEITNSHGGFEGWIVKLGDIATGAQEMSTPVLTISPNPGNDLIRVSSDKEMCKATITITDAFGRAVAHERMNGTAHWLNVGHLPAGLYTLTMRSEQEARSKRLVVD
ncbi:MAG: T9SS type A sorting domain-containing protein [Flavobacteriales bacterium]|nr:T9SS type A sorting domain-containing protein [Flavobacteriales bacterium]